MPRFSAFGFEAESIDGTARTGKRNCGLANSKAEGTLESEWLEVVIDRFLDQFRRELKVSEKALLRFIPSRKALLRFIHSRKALLRFTRSRKALLV